MRIQREDFIMNAVARRAATPVAPVLRLTNFNELVQFAQMAAKSSLVPQEYRGRAESIMLAVQLGSELGLSPMQSIQNIAVIGARPTVWGDAMLALVTAHPDCQDVIECAENGTAVCTVKRRGRTPVIRRFSVEDAKIAKLWGKPGPWVTYPDRMLQMRARGFALRDAFPDVLKGLITAEEARDIPVHNGATIDAVAEPVETPPVRAAAASMAPAPRKVSSAEYLSDSIPALDEEWPSAESEPWPDDVPAASGARAAINRAVPMRPNKPTVASWLDGFASDLALCTERDEVEATVLRDDVCKAGRTLTGAARARLQALIDAALAPYRGAGDR
jgi:hypothetical protein